MFTSFSVFNNNQGSQVITVLISVVTTLVVIGLLIAALWWGGAINVKNNGLLSTTNTNTNAASNASSSNYQIPLDIVLPNQEVEDPLAAWPAFDYVVTVNRPIISTSTTSTGTSSSRVTLFSLKYPTGWHSTSTNQVTRITNPSTSTLSEIQIRTEAMTASTTLVQYLAGRDKFTATAYEGKPAIEVKNQQAVTIAGIGGMVRYEKLLAADLDQLIAYVPLPSGRVALVSYITTAMTADSEQLFNAILSSFNVPVN